MLQARRNFATAACLFAISIAFRSSSVAAQYRNKNWPEPPAPGDPQQRDKLAPPDSKTPEQNAQQRSEERFRLEAEKLFQLSGELRDEVKNTSSTKVFSVKMYKRLQEIERLAKQMQSQVKG
jgi:hypothetical protein